MAKTLVQHKRNTSIVPGNSSIAMVEVETVEVALIMIEVAMIEVDTVEVAMVKVAVDEV